MGVCCPVCSRVVPLLSGSVTVPDPAPHRSSENIQLYWDLHIEREIEKITDRMKRRTSQLWIVQLLVVHRIRARGASRALPSPSWHRLGSRAAGPSCCCGSRARATPGRAAVAAGPRLPRSLCFGDRRTAECVCLCRLRAAGYIVAIPP